MESREVEVRRTAADILGNNPQARGNGKSQATVVEQSRAIAEVQGALVVAANRPRDKAAALNEALESCRTREVAESAFFKFSRGGSSVAGETIHLARELARCWGNIVYDVMELERDDERGMSEMMARAWDLQTNAQARLSFQVPHLRDKKGGAVRLTDVRDIYENNANMGARRLRECIFAVLPPYLVKSAADECRATLERGDSEEPLPVRISKLLTAFAQIGIDKARIEAKHGPVEKFTPVDVANLRVSYQSIRRNEISAEEEFPRTDGNGGPSKLDMLEDAITDTGTAAADALPVDEAGPQTETDEAAAFVSDHEEAGEFTDADLSAAARAKADEIISKSKLAADAKGLARIIGNAQHDLEAMPEDERARVLAAFEVAEGRIRA